MAATDSLLSPLDKAYYDQQQQNVQDTYNIGVARNTEAQQANKLTYDQKIAALQQTLAQRRNTLADSFAGRGLLNSGIYNYGTDNNLSLGSSYRGLPNSQLGAVQQFTQDASTSVANLINQQQTTNQALNEQNQLLGRTEQDQLASIQQARAASQVQQAVNDTVSGVG